MNLNVSCPYEVIAYSVLLNIFILLECTHTITRQCIHFINATVLKRILCNIQPILCPIFSENSYYLPVRLLPVLFLTNILGSIFSGPFNILNNFYFISLNLRISYVVRPHSFNISTYLISLSPGISLVALLCLLFKRVPMSFLRYCLNACIQYSK